MLLKLYHRTNERNDKRAEELCHVSEQAACVRDRQNRAAASAIDGSLPQQARRFAPGERWRCPDPIDLPDHRSTLLPNACNSPSKQDKSDLSVGRQAARQQRPSKRNEKLPSSKGQQAFFSCLLWQPGELVLVLGPPPLHPTPRPPPARCGTK